MNGYCGSCGEGWNKVALSACATPHLHEYVGPKEQEAECEYRESIARKAMNKIQDAAELDLECIGCEKRFSSSECPAWSELALCEACRYGKAGRASGWSLFLSLAMSKRCLVVCYPHSMPGMIEVHLIQGATMAQANDPQRSSGIMVIAPEVTAPCWSAVAAGTPVWVIKTLTSRLEGCPS